VALALGADQLESEQTPQRILGGDHLGSGELGLLGEGAEVDVLHQGQKEEESRDAGPELSREEVEPSNVGDGRGLGPEGFGTLLVFAARESDKPLFS